MHRHFATVCSKITRLWPKCTEKITVYQSRQNVYQLVKYFLINSRNWMPVMSNVTLHVNMTPLTDRLLIKTSQTKQGRIVKNDRGVSSDAVESACAV